MDTSNFKQKCITFYYLRRNCPEPDNQIKADLKF